MQCKDVCMVVAIYNIEKYLRSCLMSIVNQTFQPGRVILVNDGSTDGSRTIAEEFQQKYEYFTLVNQTNGGLSAARNTGIKMATEDYICFIDGDDLLDRNYLKYLYEGIVAHNADLSFGDFNQIDESDEIIPIIYPESCYQPGLQNQENVFCRIFAVGINHNEMVTVVMWNKLIKTEIMKHLLFREGVYHEDEFMILPLLLRCKKIVWVPYSIYSYRQQRNSITHNNKILMARLQVLDAYKERIEMARRENLMKYRYHMGNSYMKNITISYFRLMDQGLEPRTKELIKLRKRAFTDSVRFFPYVGKGLLLKMLLFSLDPDRYREKYYN